MFDPFNDFDTRGYLRNFNKDKDQWDIKRFEHNFFEANIDDAFSHLAASEELTYRDFLEVHRILFEDYYPWAGQDRAVTMPESAVKKGDVLFAHPNASRLAVEHGLRLGQDLARMAQKPGEVMGLFAYGHPFLDGNGRTMLLVHMELCHRADFSLAWQDTNKADYLSALSQEIDAPGKGTLDAYLLQFKAPQLERGTWGTNILAIKGLDSFDGDNQIDGDLSDPTVADKYLKHEREREYSYAMEQTLKTQWHALPGRRQEFGKIVALSGLEVIQDAGRGRFVAWDRQKLQGASLAVGDNVTINANGQIDQQRPNRTLGR